MTIFGSDPFSTLLYQQQLIGTPLEEGAANGTDPLDVAQRSITIGDVIPVVFCRRVGDIGGVLVSPGATEARFENNLANEVTASYHVVISEGEIDGIQVRDVFQRSCRVGTLTQTYSRRAGPWVPGNFIVPRAGFAKPECPYYCGTGGTYEGMTTGSYVIENVPNGDTRWDRQIHIFIRGGMYVTRLLDDAEGPSNNAADLALWLLRKTGRVPEPMIDVEAFTAAADFTDKAGLWFNGELASSANFEDWLAAHARYFLLSKSKRGGKVGLRPSLPVDANNEIDTSPITPVWVFNRDNIKEETFDLTWIPLADRKPFCALMLWRQQPEDDIGIIRTTEVRYAGRALDGPYEQHDLSEFAASENHVVKSGANIIARRRYISHTLTFRAKPQDYRGQVYQGQIVQVVMPIVPNVGPVGEHRFLYEIERMRRAEDGEVTFNLIHFPVDEEGRSLVALDIVAATGGGVILPTGKSGTSCDVNADDDTTVPPDDSLDPSEWELPDDDAFDVDIPDGSFGSGSEGDGFTGGDGGGGGGSEGDGGGEEGGGGGEGDGGTDRQDTPEIGGASPGGPVPGDTLTAPVGCADCEEYQVIWYRDGQPINGEESEGYTVGLIDAGGSLSVRIICVEEGSGPGCEPPPIDVPPVDFGGGGSDRSIGATFTITNNSQGLNSCTDGSEVVPGSSDSFSDSVFGFGVGFRVARGSSFQSQTCGSANGGGAIPGTGILIQLVKADGSTTDAYLGSASFSIVVGPESVGSYASGFLSRGLSGLTLL
jgi:uncharacterized membrane protein YgcG